MRDETQYVAAVKDAGASEGEDRAQSSYYSAHRTDADKVDRPSRSGARGI